MSLSTPAQTTSSLSPARKPASRPALPAALQHTTPAPTLQYQGAEALLYRTTFLGHAAALKHRPSKAYRHPILDAKLTRHRILQETRILVRLRKEGLDVPALYALDWEAGWFMMEWIEGCSVRVLLDNLLASWLNADGPETGPLWELMGRIGAVVGRMHETGVVHGDLTTSNLMLALPQDSATEEMLADGETANVQELARGRVVLIDFGLAAQSVQDEDRAVDLYVLERAFGNTHPNTGKLFHEFLRVYGQAYKNGRQVLKRYEEVRMRGRKRILIG